MIYPPKSWPPAPPATPVPSPLPTPTPVKLRRIVLGAIALVVLSLAGLLAPVELLMFIGVGFQIVPFMILAVLAYLGIDRPWARVTAILGWLVTAGGYALVALFVSVAAVIGPFSAAGGLPHLAGGQALQLALLLLGLLLAPAIGALGFIPGVRRALSRRLPLDPASFVHTIALVTVVTMILISVVPLLVLAAPPLLTMTSNLTVGSQALGDTNDSQLRSQVYTLVWTLPCAIFAVGYRIRRNWRDALTRLGLVRPGGRQVLAGLGLAVLAVIASQGLDWAVTHAWSAAGWPQTDQTALNKLLAFALRPIGAVILGVTAGLGEEVAVRGVLQPRLGILLSNVFFTSLHALQYNWDALLSVFLLGLVLGVIRQRTNTTTSAIVHGTYDALLVLISLLPGP